MMNTKKPPWMIPIPLRQAPYTSYKNEHQHLAVETDLRRLEIAGLHGATSTKLKLGYADLQEGLFHVQGRLGSGRSCHFGRWYLKGMGRTPLAANWNRPDDFYHHSGHLLPTAGIREFLVTVLAKGIGLAAAIIPCQGLLLGENTPLLKAGVGELYQNATPPSLDANFRALTIKPGGFVRPSNLLWMLTKVLAGDENAASGDFSISHYFALLANALGLPDEEDGDLSVESICASLQSAFETTMQNLSAFFHAGLYWVSFDNNMTLDGRFLDLEIPLFTGRALLGGFGARNPAILPHGSALVPFGAEFFHIMAQWRYFVLAHQSHFRFLASRCGACGDKTGEALCHEVATLFAKVFSQQHVLFCEEAAIDMVAQILSRAENFGQLSRLKTEKLLRFWHARFLGVLSGQNLQDIGWKPLGWTFARVEHKRWADFYVPHLPQKSLRPCQLMEAFNFWLTELEHSQTYREVFNTLDKAIADLNRKAKERQS